MPTYQFVNQQPDRKDLPETRISAAWAQIDFDKAEYTQLGDTGLLLKNCEGSIIIADKTKPGLNKLHIGELQIRNPHIESYQERGEEGPRADLHNWDIVYASERLNELLKWRDPQYLEGLRQRYAGFTWYSVPHRLKQIEISPEGLERKIGEMKKLVHRLESIPDNNFISDRALLIEGRTSVLVTLMRLHREKFDKDVKIGKGKPKIIVAPEILTKADELYRMLREILDFTVPKIDMEQATRYWQGVDAWEKM